MPESARPAGVSRRKKPPEVDAAGPSDASARELADHLELALSAGRLGTWRWDRASGITVWDPTLETLFGVEPGTFGGTFEDWVSLLPLTQYVSYAEATPTPGSP